MRKSILWIAATWALGSVAARAAEPPGSLDYEAAPRACN